MPRIPILLDKQALAERGEQRMLAFCKANGIPAPAVTVTPKSKWRVGACAYYRPDTEQMRKWTKPGINICLEECQWPCGETVSRNWTWPGSTTDREPYGVIAHELDTTAIGLRERSGGATARSTASRL